MWCVLGRPELRRRNVVDFYKSKASAAIHSRETGGVRAWRQGRQHGRLQWVGRRQSQSGDLRGFGSICQLSLDWIIVPLLLNRSKVGSASTEESPESARLGPSPRITTLSLPVPWPRMMPAITTLLPVLTNARVLRFASLGISLLAQIIHFHQADSGGGVLMAS